MKNRMVTGSSQHGFMKGKSCLTNVIAFCDKMTDLMDEGRVVGIFNLSFCDVFDTVLYNILIRKLMKYGLGKWTMRWTEN